MSESVQLSPKGFGRVAQAWDRRDWREFGALAAAIVALHVVGFGSLVLLVAPHHYQVGTQVFGVGLGVTAYMFGLRHAFDADHIAAIDNTTRKLLTERSEARRPLSVGFWFSLGHSTVVFVLVVLLALGVRSLAGQLSDESSLLQQVCGSRG